MVVTSNSDNGSGGCTIREALDSVNAGSASGGCVDILPPPQPPLASNFGINDTVIFGNTLASDTVTLNGTSLEVTKPVTVSGYEGLTIDGNLQSTVITIDSTVLTLNDTIITGGSRGVLSSRSTVRLNNCFVTNNRGDSDSPGGGINVYRGSLTLENTSIINNTAGYGGGILTSYADLTITNSKVDNNQSVYAGGIQAFRSSLTITNSSVSGNTANARAGGIYSSESNLSIIASEISNNISAGEGAGGILVDGATLTLSNSSVSNNRTGGSLDGGGISLKGSATLQGGNSTISGNRTNYDGAGVRSYGDGDTAIINLSNVTIEGNAAGSSGGGIWTKSTRVSLSNSTIANNSASPNSVSGLFMADQTLQLTNTIIANNFGLIECNISTGSITTDSATIVQDETCNSQRAIDPQLGPLADNGGSTLTMALKPNSPARNTGNSATCETRDQRGQLRDDGDGACDVGAIEFNQNDNFGDQSSFYAIPLKNNKAVVIPL